MKFALCLHGLSHGNNDKRNNPIMYDLGYKMIKTELLDKYDIDVFVHTWNAGGKEKILRDYSPKKWIIGDKVNHGGTPRPRQSSNLCSYTKSNQLRKDYEEEMGFKYDCVILTRFDLVLSLNMDLCELDMSKFYFPATYKSPQWTFQYHKDAFYMMEWILISCGENIDKFCSFYKKIPKFYKLSFENINNMNSKDGIRRNNKNPHHMFMYFLLHPESGLSECLEMIPIEKMAACSGNCVTITGKYKFKEFQKRFPCFSRLDYIEDVV
jgi:hypothetical protein